VGGIAVVNILYGALAALWQTDIKYLIAYSSVSHMGVVMLGIATGNSTGWTGAVLQMVAHGWMTALLFTLVGIIYDETHERRIEKLHGLGRRMPRLAAAWMLASLSSLGLPGLGGFVAELYTFTGAWQKNALWAIAGAFGAWITAVYLLRVARAIIFAGEADCGHDITGFDRVTPWVLGGALLLMGLWPRFLIDGIEPQVRLWLAGAGLLP
jgi:NADH-quinone oxidoreductase subunit M